MNSKAPLFAVLIRTAAFQVMLSTLAGCVNGETPSKLTYAGISDAVDLVQWHEEAARSTTVNYAGEGCSLQLTSKDRDVFLDVVNRAKPVPQASKRITDGAPVRLFLGSGGVVAFSGDGYVVDQSGITRRMSQSDRKIASSLAFKLISPHNCGPLQPEKL